MLWALLPLFLLLGACNDDSTDSRKQLEKLIAEQKVKDDAAIKAYLQTNNITNFEQKESGLYIIRLNTPGTGPMPVAGNQVEARYIGRFLSTGLRFDASIDNGSPRGSAVFVVGGVIEGWNEVLKTMHKGDKVTILVPSHLGYGYTGTQDGRIPGFTPLIFDIELLEVLP
ncbi:hypothetical protein GCM10027048_23000 [Hymenobacter coalescens]